MARQQYYGIIGNGETCALISVAGNIEWLCLPQFDGNPVFSKTISSLGESLDVDINENDRELAATQSSHEYVENTAILKTSLRFSAISAEFTDFMPWPEPEAMESEKRIIFRILHMRNISGKTRRFSVKVRRNRGGNRKEVKEGRIISSDSYAYAVTFLGNRLDVMLRPRESAEIPIIIVYGGSENEVKTIL